MNNQNEPLSKNYRTWVEVNKQAIGKNIEAFRGRIASTTLLMAVVKSNAYGHGLITFTKEVEKNIDWIGVDSAVEALVLRREGVTKPILVLGYTLPSKFPEIVEKNVHINVSSFEQLEAIKSAKLGEKLSVHIKVDTGMHRQGFSLTDEETLFKMLNACKQEIFIAGLFTHFAAAKNPEGPDETKKQIKECNKWRELFTKNGYTPIVHASATAGTLLYPEAHFDLVRIGIGLYGLWPSLEVYEHEKNSISLTPVLSWKTVVSEVKNVRKGEKVGYDFTEELTRDSKLAICPIGYWHGYVRALSSKGEVLVHGKRAKVVGRVSMGMIVIDVTNIPGAQVGDVATLLGKDGDDEITAEELALQAGTINYEIVTGINPRIKRVEV